MEINKTEYELDFFKEYGFIRKQGEKCKQYFWTLNPELKEPPDTPCIEYRFEKIRSIKPLSVSEARKLFIDFFAERGHTPLKPRPVVARWRDDLYLTIASIVVFQPHVTSGLVPPPANPLVISQPSIRLEDIDNVGVTIGRHLTTFEMAAHHAFNYPDKQVYWKDQTVRYAFEFFTKYMKIPPEEIVFVESWWEGGGNAGPSFEVVVGGIELATLVFMKYKVIDGKYEEIPLKIVDTGYGVERLAWFTQKTPTAFHAIFGELVEKFRDILNVEKPDPEILWSAFKEAGKLDAEDPQSLREYYRRVGERSGYGEKAKAVLEQEARLYSILDHTRTLALMLADGIVPSNTGEGYLARLVARRTLKQIRLLGAEVSIVDLVDMQIEYWKRDFPQMIENRAYILDAVSLEEDKFNEVITKGYSLIRKLVKKKKELSTEDLVRLYDSNGLPPEIVVEIASKLGVNIEVPHNFYSIVASRHQAPVKIRQIGEKTSLPEEIINWAMNLPETRKLYYEDPYMREFTARVVSYNGKYLVLDQTAFYPKGGGQDTDKGIITCGDKKFDVIHVDKVGETVVHVLDQSFQCESSTVSGKIDWNRRYRLMRHHTGTHVIIGALRRILGNHVWQAGAEKTIEKARLDFTHHRPLTKEQIRLIEKEANRIIDEKRRVKVFYMPRNEAEEKYGFTLYQGGVPMKPIIRIVEIEDWDIEGCGGTHLTNTGEIGGLKIINVDKIQDGVIRIEYVAGTRLSEYAQELEDILQEASEITGTSPHQLPNKLRKLQESFENTIKKLNTYRKLYQEILQDKIEKTDKKVIIEEYPEPDRKAIQETLRKLTTIYSGKIIALYYKVDESVQIEIAAGNNVDIHLGSKIREIAANHGLKGGGSKTYASLRVPIEKFDQLVKELEELDT